MATWKKVYVEGDDIPVTDGGTGLGSLPDGEVLIGDGTGAIESVELISAQLLVGAGVDSTSNANPTAQDVGGNLTMDASGDFTISALQVTGGGASGMIQEDTTLWTYNESSITGLSNATPRLPFYKPNLASSATQVNADTVAPPTTAGDTLQYDAGNNTLIWAAGSTSFLSITDRAAQNESDAALADYHIAFVAGTSGSDGFNVDSTDLTYNPFTNLLTNGFVTLDGDVAYSVGSLGAGDQGSAAAVNGGTITASKFVGLASEARKVDIHAVTSGGNTHAIPFYQGNALGFQPLMSESDATFAYTPTSGLLNVTSITASDTITTVDLTVTNIINGDISGNAATADQIDISADASSTSNRFLTFVTATGTGAAQTLYADSSDLIYIPEDPGTSTDGDDILGGTLKVPNLIVTGTTTTLNTNVLEVQDSKITVAIENLTDIGAGGAGIYVDINDAAEANIPSLSYAGYSAANTPSGWNIQRANHATAGSTGVSTGIGTMEVSAVYNNIVDDANELNDVLDINPGAFCYSTAEGGGLFIQTT